MNRALNLPSSLEPSKLCMSKYSDKTRIINWKFYLWILNNTNSCNNTLLGILKENPLNIALHLITFPYSMKCFIK